MKLCGHPCLWPLERPYQDLPEATGQVDAALAVLRKNLSGGHALSMVVSYLEGHCRFREAPALTEQDSKAFPDDWRLRDDVMRCYR